MLPEYQFYSCHSFFFERSLATFSTAFIIDLQGRQSELGMEYDGRDTGADKTEVCAGCSR